MASTSLALPCHQQAACLPDDIIEDIFARMPAKSVLRCRCLSRAWAATLSSAAFVDRHHDLANRRGGVPNLCSLPGSRSAAASTVYAWSPPPEGGGKKNGFTPLMVVPHNTRNGGLRAVTRPCHGLVLLRAVAARLYYLCNPSIGQITALPDGRMAGGAPPQPRRDYASFGLGYDARARTHKVVRLLYGAGEPAGCDVYDVANGAGHWRPAGVVPPDHVRMNEMGVFTHGHVHWVTMRYDGGGEDDYTVSFSMADEEFGRVTPPPGEAVEGSRAGCLCLVSAPHGPLSPLKRIDIWLLASYAARAWEKHWRIDLATPPLEVGGHFMLNAVTPIAVVNGGRRIVFVSSQGTQAAAYYCLATGTLEELVPRPRDDGRAIQTLAPYEESLVSVGRPFEDVLFSPPHALALSMALRRLPARALARLKLVCRSWRAMIESERFARWHNTTAAAAASQTTTPLSVVFVHPFDSAAALIPVDEFFDPLGSPFVSLDSCSGDDGAGAGRRFMPPMSTARVVCRKPCRGLVLLSHQTGNCHVLVNPVTQAVRTFTCYNDGRHGCAGLGYDESKEEHVMVRLSYASSSQCSNEAAIECTVWPLRDLRPRKLPCRPPIPVAVDMPPVHVGGWMYWSGERTALAAAGTAPYPALVAFDVRAETFEVVPAGTAARFVRRGCRLQRQDDPHGACWEPVRRGLVCDHGDDGSMEQEERGRVDEGTRDRAGPMAGVLPAVHGAGGDGRILLDTGKALGYYDSRSRSLETVYSLKSQLANDQHSAGNMFFIATLGEDSLVCPYDRKCRIW
ncbi:hypothetical protein EJB05_00299, partial [Eragrostis curvula]